MSLARGTAAFNAGRFEEALAQFRAARPAEAVQARCLAAHCLASLGRASEAEAEFRAAARLPGAGAAPWLGLSELLRRAGRLNEAGAAAKRASRLAPGAAAASALREVRRSRVQLRSRPAPGRRAEAPVARPKAADGPAELARAGELEVSGRWREAEALYRRLLKTGPRSRAVLAGLAHTLAAQGREAAALRCLRQGARAADDAQGESQRFVLAMRVGDYDAAFAAGERLLDARPSGRELRLFWNPWRWDSTPDARGFRAHHRRRLDAWIARHPRSPWGWFYRGALEPGRERLRDFDRALAAAGRRGRYRWMALKAGWARLGVSPRAATLLSRAAAARPRDWWAHGFLAEALLLERRPRQALASAGRAVREAAAERPAALAWRGELQLWLGRYADALRDLRAARGAAPAFSSTWEAAALYKLGRAAEAERLLGELLERYPRDVEARVWRGETLRALGRPQEALRALPDPAASFWARVNRTLSLLDLGRVAAARSEFARVAASERSLTAPRGAEPGALRASLEALLARAGGYRRDDYLREAWLAGGVRGDAL